MLAGEPDSYTGEAVNPANLSWCEGMLGVGRAYKRAVEPENETRNGAH